MQRRSCRAQRIEDEQGRSPLPRQEPVPLFRRHGVRTPGPRQIEGLGGAPVRQGRRDGQSFCKPLTACPTDSWRPPRGLPRPPGRHVRSGGGPGGSPPRRKRRCNTGGPPRLRATPVARDRSVRDRPCPRTRPPPESARQAALWRAARRRASALRAGPRALWLSERTSAWKHPRRTPSDMNHPSACAARAAGSGTRRRAAGPIPRSHLSLAVCPMNRRAPALRPATALRD